MIIRGFDGEGDEIDVSIEDILDIHYEATKIIYIYYMLNVKGATFREFERNHLAYYKETLHEISSTYEEHIEGMLNSKIEEDEYEE